MPNSESGEGKERRIRDMLGLVKFCLETTAREDPNSGGMSTSSFEPMDRDRQVWLQQAIANMTVDTTRQLLENLALVKETIANMAKNPNGDIPVQKTCDAIEVLTDLCEEIDYAADFAKLDGFSVFSSLIGCQYEDMTVKACGLIAALAQNNPICQDMALNTRLLEKLIEFVDLKDNLTHIKARSYALYAISSIIRSNQEVRSHFETHLEGLSVLLKLLDIQMSNPAMEMSSSPIKSKGDDSTSPAYWLRKLRIRSIFLFRTLCSESRNASTFFFEKQAIKSITSQLEQSDDPEIREHLLHALQAFLTSLDVGKQVESFKLVPNLRNIIEKTHSSSSQESSVDYELTDTKSTCKELLNLIDSLEKN